MRPSLLRGVFPRLESFVRPFAEALQTPEQRTNAHHYVQGLLSNLASKDAESIAYLHDQDRQVLQKFVGQSDWDHRPLVTELAKQIVRHGFVRNCASVRNSICWRCRRTRWCET